MAAVKKAPARKAAAPKKPAVPQGKKFRKVKMGIIGRGMISDTYF